MGIGGGEIFLIVLVVLIFFGADKIPEVARGLGKAMREFKRATDDIKEEFTRSTEEVKRDFENVKDDVKKDFDAVKDDVHKTIKHDEDPFL